MVREDRKSVTLDKAIQSFFKALEPEGLAEVTLASKRRTLEALARTVGRANRSTRKLTKEDFDACLTLLEEGLSDEENAARRLKGLVPVRGRSLASRRQDRAALRQFAEHLRDNGWVKPTFHPLKRITVSTRPNGNLEADKIRKRRGIPYDQWENLIEAAGSHHPRTRIIVAIGLLFGRRAGEIAYLRWEHIRGGRIEFFNIKKGRPVNSTGMVISPWAKEELDRWQRWVEKAHGPVQPEWPVIPAKPKFSDPEVAEFRRHSYLYPVDPARPVPVRTIIEDIQSAFIRFGWSKAVRYGEGGHTLRRSFGQEMELRVGAEAVQAGYDHKTTAQTQYYTGNRAGQRDLDKGLSGLARPGSTLESAPEVAPEPEPVPAQREAGVVSLADWRKARRAG